MISESESPAYLGSSPDPYPLDCWPVDTVPANILEVGAGAGMGTLQLAEHFPEARITCLEPGDTPRAVLAWRIADRADLRQRVSVLPLTVQKSSELPTYDLIVAHHVLCQVPVSDRKAFWTALAKRLASAGQVLIDDHFGPTSSNAVERKLAAQGWSGAYRVSRWFEAETIDDSKRSVINEYTIQDEAGRVIYCDRRVDEQEVVDRESSLRLPSLCGLEVAEATSGWLRLMRSLKAGGDV